MTTSSVSVKSLKPVKKAPIDKLRETRHEPIRRPKAAPGHSQTTSSKSRKILALDEATSALDLESWKFG
ncbi:hypothetical protein AJ79_01570 [Helicocarpus griseus UAMH5409]|uniref:Uncharacterized protein n=1 Tax=Helicocarpus griseus UAMH5409 TaxID=1447875 RepID=A0A2B7Y7V6_9EURO|nr:hypothetical protein AJ79_01570 [Helicocarpus griseus UAMH5409]